MDTPITKDALLRQADGLRGLARQARRLAETMTKTSDRHRLGRYVGELEESAASLERDAAEAKSGQIASRGAFTL